MNAGSISSSVGMAKGTSNQITLKILDTSGLSVRNIGGEQKQQQGGAEVKSMQQNGNGPNPTKIDLLI